MTATKIQLHPDGPQFSRIIPGLMRLSGWEMSTDDLVNWIETCLDWGITTFDHADIYGGHTCEGIFGAALARKPSLRAQMQLVTKCGVRMKSVPGNRVGHYNTTTAYILGQAEQSLKNLNTDHIDVLLIHRPDPLMDADDIAEAFMKLKQDGKVLHFGVSNFTTTQFDLLQSRLSVPLVTNQVEFSVMHVDPIYDGTFDQQQQHRHPPMAWSPLAGGRMFSAEDEQSQRVRDMLQQVGEELGGAPIDQVALAWVLKHPVKAMPVLGTGKLERVQAALDAEKLELDHNQWFMILEASNGHPVP